MIVETASLQDAPAILELQKLAYQSEAALYQDPTIQPLLQNLEEIEAEFVNHTFLKGLIAGTIVASVRAYLRNETCFIGKLIVHPTQQNQGLGTRMMDKIEQLFPEAKRFELFTGYKSERNLHLYTKLGYREFQRQQIHERLTFVFLEKWVSVKQTKHLS